MLALEQHGDIVTTEIPAAEQLHETLQASFTGYVLHAAENTVYTGPVGSARQAFKHVSTTTRRQAVGALHRSVSTPL